MEPRFKRMDRCGVFNPRLQVPGWAETCAAEAELRNDAMLGLDESILGLPVVPLSWRHLLWLDIYNSPFLTTASVEQLLQIPAGLLCYDVARFMWVLSPRWRPYGWARRKLFFWKYRRRLFGRPDNLVAIVKAIHQFMDESLWDLKSVSGGSGKTYFSAAAGIVHLLCEQYGALSPDPNSASAAIDVPMKIIGQLLRARIQVEAPAKESRRILSNRADELERQWLADYNDWLKTN